MEEAPDAELLSSGLASRSEPLWPGAEHGAARSALGPRLVAVLQSARSAGRIVRGIEGSERALASEARGQKQVDRRTGVDRGARVSRILVVTDDGSERFYRNVDWLLGRHAPRLLALRLACDERVLGRLLFGPDAVARALLLAHKDAVSEFLLALAAQWGEET